MELAGWGRFPKADCQVLRPRSESDLRMAISKGPVIARGLGRAYGDSAMNRQATVNMTAFNHMLAFDPSSGVLTVEAGVVLRDIIDIFLPQGWFPPVTPGTKFVTIGGMIAADVHGKNHHKHGSFGNFLEWLDLLGPTGEVQRCSTQENSELFAYTIGGMGLTGIILRAAFRLVRVESGWIRRKTVLARNFEEAMAAFDAADNWTYSVAWIDCLALEKRLGNSLLFLGEHARSEELHHTIRANPFTTPGRRSMAVPFEVPGWVLRIGSIKAFNVFYRWKEGRASTEALVDFDRYFYPLDAILDWNRLYGRNGFAQFQCVLPLETSHAGLSELLSAIAKSGQGSLAVLKRLGKQEGRFSFPMEGYTLALDLPVTRQALALLERLDEITLTYGGRFYLAKDSRMSAKTLQRSDKRIAAFQIMRKETLTSTKFSSIQSERLSI